MQKQKEEKEYINKCANCWFYCHRDGKCYEDIRSHYEPEYAYAANPDEVCCAWSPDGLTAEERDALDALMTMEVTHNDVRSYE